MVTVGSYHIIAVAATSKIREHAYITNSSSSKNEEKSLCKVQDLSKESWTEELLSNICINKL